MSLPEGILTYQKPGWRIPVSVRAPLVNALLAADLLIQQLASSPGAYVTVSLVDGTGSITWRPTDAA